MTKTGTRNKTVQRLLDRHATLREQYSAAYAAVETSDDGDPSGKLAAKRDKVGDQLAAAAEKLRERGYTLEHADSVPVAPTLAEPTPSTPSAGYTWPKDPSAVLGEYLAERTSADADAPNRRLPFVTGGVLRVHPSDWSAWLTDHGMPAPRREALAVLKSAELVQKVYALPGEDGRSAGFYTGPVPAGVELPERVVQRGGNRGQRSPFGKLSAEQRAVVTAALQGLSKTALRGVGDKDGVTRDQLLAHLEPSAD